MACSTCTMLAFIARTSAESCPAIRTKASAILASTRPVGMSPIPYGVSADACVIA